MRHLCLFCSPGVRSGVINKLHICSGLPDDLNLSLFLRIKNFSCIGLTVIFSRRGLSDFFPRRTALVMDAEVPKWSWNIEVHFLISSSFLLSPSGAVDSCRLCKMMLSCRFSFSLCSSAKDDAKLTTDSSGIERSGWQGQVHLIVDCHQHWLWNCDIL